MWNKKHFAILSDDGGATSLTATDFGVVGFEGGVGGADILSIKVRGKTNYEAPYGVGYSTASGTQLNLRIHGECFMDGKELVRLMKKSSTPVYGGDEGSTHFLYLSKSDKDYEVVPSDYALIGKNPISAEMTVTLSEDINGGGSLVPGLNFKSVSGSTIAISSSTSGIGDVKLTAKTSAFHTCAELIHKRSSKEMTLPVRYNSVKISALGSSASKYVGQNVSFNIGRPLYGFYGDDFEFSDELECVTGCLTRRVGCRPITEDDTFTEVTYNDYVCYRLDLGERVGSEHLSINGFTSLADPSELNLANEAVFVAPDRRGVYFYTNAEENRLEIIKDFAIGKNLLYVLENEEVTYISSPIIPYTGEKKIYVEACSATFPEIEVKYLAKE